MFALLLFLPFVGLGVYRIFHHSDDSGWWWIVAGIVIVGGVAGPQIKDGCVTDWDGRTNSVFCD